MSNAFKLRTSPCVMLVAALLLAAPACTSSTTSGSIDLPIEPPNAGLEAGLPAPEIAGDDTDGKQVKLSQYRGKVVLIDFWATWCGPCVREIPNEKALVEKFKGRPFTILGISADRTREELTEFLDKDKLPWPNVFDADDRIARTWEVRGFPTFFLVDAKGVIAGHWVGSGQSDEIEKAVEGAVKDAEENQR